MMFDDDLFLPLVERNIYIKVQFYRYNRFWNPIMHGPPEYVRLGKTIPARNYILKSGDDQYTESYKFLGIVYGTPYSILPRLMEFDKPPHKRKVRSDKGQKRKARVGKSTIPITNCFEVPLPEVGIDEFELVEVK